MEKLVLNVEGMSCNHCVMAIKKALGALRSVSNVDVSLEGKKVTLDYDKTEVTIGKIKEAIEDQGYNVIL